MPIPTQPNRLTLPLNEINTEGRIRQDYGDMEDLKTSLKTHGLLQPIVVNQQKQLIAGGRRYRAHQELGESSIAVVFFETLDEVHLRVLEVEENIRRKDFDWKERVLAIAVAHETAKRTAILERGAKQWTQAQTGDLLGQSVGNVNNALRLASLIRAGDKEIISADGPKEALGLLLLRKEREAQKNLAAFISGKATAGTGISQTEANSVLDSVRKSLEGTGEEEGFYDRPTSPISGSTASGGTVMAPSLGDEMPGGQTAVAEITIPLSRMILKGDSITLMSQMTPGSIDHIITDIPYGIDMEMLAQDNASTGTTSSINSVADTHGVEANVALFEPFLQASFRLLPDSGFCIFFLDIEHWEKLRDLAYKTGFKVQRWPLVWHKTHTCKNQSAQYNFTKNTEIAMVCRKGNATLISPQGSSVWAGTNEVERQMLGHPFVKPLKLWQWLFNSIAIRGQKLYDPFAGVGSMPIAAVEAGFVPVCSEIEEVHYNRLVVNVANAYKNLYPQVVFK
jgi:ParB family transcriptional regulator, chromosome partitioning protein